MFLVVNCSLAEFFLAMNIRTDYIEGSVDRVTIEFPIVIDSCSVQQPDFSDRVDQAVLEYRAKYKND